MRTVCSHYTGLLLDNQPADSCKILTSSSHQTNLHPLRAFILAFSSSATEVSDDQPEQPFNLALGYHEMYSLMDRCQQASVHEHQRLLPAIEIEIQHSSRFILDAAGQLLAGHLRHHSRIVGSNAAVFAQNPHPFSISAHASCGAVPSCNFVALFSSAAPQYSHMQQKILARR